ncbi:MAG: polysaccharide deacetylase family protein [Actinomycetota bacterium]|nr:polysaccharide deacetylase family protein [Actinomycetota bacterium]
MGAVAHARGHRLVLVYHRIGAPPGRVVPAVPADLFRAHLQALSEVVDLVPLEEIVADGPSGSERRGRRPKVAVTLDDDLRSHAAEALPILRALGVPAAFFLSGRALHGLGAYWFQQLEVLLAVHGEDGTAARLGLAGRSPGGLTLACERDDVLRERVSELAADVPDPGLLDCDGIVELAAAGMTIGFHTLDHRIMPTMDDDALDDAVNRGRGALAAAAGSPLRFFAYPHGQADVRSAAAVRRAGFDAAWTGRPQPVRPGGDRYRLGRWEPGPLDVDELLVKLPVRLHGVTDAARRMSG